MVTRPVGYLDQDVLCWYLFFKNLESNRNETKNIT